jgi:phage repressor protein C with HTH and peptisase S24 domain
MSVDKFAERVKELQGEDSVRGFARRIGLTDGALRGIYAGGKPTLDTLLALAQGNNVNLEWLATGEGPMRPSDSTALVAVNSNIPPEIAEDLVLIRKLEVQASAGVGALALHDEDEVGELEFLAVQASWLRARGINPTFCRVLTAKGDSMEPTIRDGDTMIIDTSIDRARDNHIYVIVFNGLVFVKRIHMKMSGAVLLISDNQVYPADEVPAADVPNLRLAGRLVWAGRFY